MTELTLLMIACMLIFFVLRIIFKSDELNVMSILISVVALCCILRDTEIAGDDLILYIVPTVYICLMSIVSIIPWGEKK